MPRASSGAGAVSLLTHENGSGRCRIGLMVQPAFFVTSVSSPLSFIWARTTWVEDRPFASSADLMVGADSMALRSF